MHGCSKASSSTKVLNGYGVRRVDHARKRRPVQGSSEKSKLLFTPSNDNETGGRHFYDEDPST